MIDRGAPAAAVAPLALDEYQDTVRAALAEDIGAGDVTTDATVAPQQRARAVLVAKSRCVVAGLDVAAEAFRQRDADVVIVRHRADGDWCEPGTVVAEVSGPRGGAADVPSAWRSTSCSGCRARPRWRAGSPTLPAAASWSWIHGRPRRSCAFSRSTPCASAAPPTIASAWTTAC